MNNISKEERMKRIQEDMLEWLETNHKGRMMNKEDIMSYTGLSRTSVYKLTDGIETPIRSCYHYKDVAARICNMYAANSE